MVNTIKNICLAIIGGSFLTLMIQTNSYLAKDTSAIFASWVAHGVGAVTALLIVLITYRLLSGQGNAQQVKERKKIPLWLYLGGIPGAFTVILAALAINGGLSLSSTISLGLVGQIAFGIVSDYFGLLNTQKRKITMIDMGVISLVLIGSMMILFGA
ncbi:membrane protein [Photobacterium galatheae]|uniref:Membrane protein n=2 Tax=Photobacterium galatheae TaxID=1654360 RepID=A0A066RW42_9GAMM|nr:membrane protein [Photobacterium galatheae]